MNLTRTAGGLGTSETVRLSRRCLLARLAALPAMFGFAAVADPESSRAKNRHGKGNPHHRSKHKGKRGIRGGTYAPDSEELAFLTLINNYRGQHGASPLALQPNLGAAANHHANAMARQNVFQHSRLENVETFGYRHWRFLGENICAGQTSASSAMDAWMNSAGHNKNMLSKNFTEIGIGRAYSKRSKYGWYWTTTFGRR